MATPLDPNEIVTLEELAISNMREMTLADRRLAKEKAHPISRSGPSTHDTNH